MSYGVFRRRYIAPPPPQSRILVKATAPALIVNNNYTSVANLGSGVYRVTPVESQPPGWTADAVSATSRTADFILRVQPESLTHTYMAGMNADPLTSGHYSDLDYALYFNAGSLEIYESGVPIGGFGTYTDSVPVWIVRSGSTVTYRQGAEASTATILRTVSSSTALYFDSSFNGTPTGTLTVSLIDGAPTGRANETDAAIGLAIALGVGRADETDTAFELSSPVIGRADETDTALGLSAAIGLGRASETDTALGLASAIGLGLASETDTAFGLAATIGLGRASETDTALALNPVLMLALGMASETDNAYALTAWVNAAGSADSWAAAGASSPTWTAVEPTNASWTS